MVICVVTSLETLEIRPAICYPLLASKMIDCEMNDLEWLFYVKIRFWPAIAELLIGYVCKSVSN